MYRHARLVLPGWSRGTSRLAGMRVDTAIAWRLYRCNRGGRCTVLTGPVAARHPGACAVVFASVVLGSEAIHRIQPPSALSHAMPHLS